MLTAHSGNLRFMKKTPLRAVGVILLSTALLIFSVSFVRAQTTSEACQADLNNDGVVNLSDFSILRMQFRFTATAGTSSADFNHDGKVDLWDYSFLIHHFFQFCPEHTASPSSSPSSSPLSSPSPSPVVSPSPASSPSTAPSPSPSPTSSEQGAAITGQYRNLFKEIGKTDAEIQAKIDAAWNSLFHGDDNQTVFRSVGTDMAYIEDVAHGDIRSEGQSYGMMIAVQLNKRDEFDRLWKFAKTYMRCPRAGQCQTGTGLDGYFSWQVSKQPPYTAIDQNPAPDGEEYFATSLLFAAQRWGNTGQMNYQADAQSILDAMLNASREQGVHAMIDPVKNVIVFSPMGSAAQYSDPSYHLPAFYEVWARSDQNPAQRARWATVAQQSRAYWKIAAGDNNSCTNGLMPDCSTLEGVPTEGCAGGARYSYDAWRAISNVAVDAAWWSRDPWEVTEVNRLQNFFGPRRTSYDNQWNLDGSSAGGQQNSTGQIAMNGVASLVSSNQYSTAFINDVWNLSLPTGQYRYYDGMLYLLSLLHLSGNFRAYY
jgi:oligosaccharide reducing-end xylanase